MDNKLYKDFSLFLAVSGKTITEIARKANISRSTLYNWRRGGQKLSERKQAQLRQYIDSCSAVD